MGELHPVLGSIATLHPAPETERPNHPPERDRQPAERGKRPLGSPGVRRAQKPEFDREVQADGIGGTESGGTETPSAGVNQLHK